MRGTEVSEFIDSAYTWQERATKAEAEVERLRAEVNSYNTTLGEIISECAANMQEKEQENERLRLCVKSITGGLDEAIETNHYLEKIIDGLNADLRIVATDESTVGYPCICSICELACKCPDEKRDPYSNEDSLCKFAWRGLKEDD